MSQFTVRRPHVGFVFLLLASTVFAGDWPQIHGPSRDGVAQGETLLESWPAAGPKKGWEANVGLGFGGVAVADNRVFVFHRVDDVERIEALDLKTGKSVWKQDFKAHYRGGVNRDTGPRCVPVVSGDRVLVFGAAGDLHCVKRADGSKLWSRELYQDYRGDEGYFGAGSTPIVSGQHVIVNVGGRNDAGIVAVSLADGKTIWKVTDEKASYSSPVAAKIGGKNQIIFLTRLNTISVDPQSGKQLFRFEHGKLGPTVNAAVPIIYNDQVFVTASYRIGGKAVKIDDGKVSEVWANDDSLSSQYNSPLYFDGHLYGVHGREDFGPTALRCVDAKTGKVKWSEESIGVAHVIRAGKALLVVEVDGNVSVVAATPEGFRRMAKASLTSQVTRALPALSRGRLILRTTEADGGKLLCYVVGKE